MARDFDGSNQYMRIADSSTGGLLDFGTSSFSIAAWVKPDDYGGNEANIVRKDPGGTERGVYLVRIKQTTGELEFQVGTTVGFPTSFTTITGATPIPTSSWTHVVAVRDRGSDVIRVYVNGVEDATAVTDKDGNCDNSGSFTIGAYYDDGAVNINGSPYDGKIAEVGVWVEALSSANISALSKGFSPAFLKQNLRAYYPLIGNNSPETDLKNGLNLTLTNSPAKANHPRIIYPTGYQITPFSSGTTTSTSTTTTSTSSSTTTTRSTSTTTTSTSSSTTTTRSTSTTTTSTSSSTTTTRSTSTTTTSTSSSTTTTSTSSSTSSSTTTTSTSSSTTTTRSTSTTVSVTTSTSTTTTSTSSSTTSSTSSSTTTTSTSSSTTSSTSTTTTSTSSSTTSSTSSSTTTTIAFTTSTSTTTTSTSTTTTSTSTTSTTTTSTSSSSSSSTTYTTPYEFSIDGFDQEQLTEDKGYSIPFDDR